jgi:hypothetical protein
VLTAVSLLAWAAFASTVQVLVYRRGLRSWPPDDGIEGEPVAGVWGINRTVGARKKAHTRRFDPRAVSLSAVVAFALLLGSTEWVFLGAMTAWLVAAWALSRADREPLRAGAAFAAILAGGAFVFALGGGVGLDAALRRALRAGLLVLTATWLRAAAGSDGLREVSRRVLSRLRAIPSAPEASSVLDGIESEGRLAAAARALTDRLGETRKHPRDLLDAVLAWVVRESSAAHPASRAASRPLNAGPTDWLLIASTAAPLLAIAFG